MYSSDLNAIEDIYGVIRYEFLYIAQILYFKLNRELLI